jgi:hypothetical protein
VPDSGKTPVLTEAGAATIIVVVMIVAADRLLGGDRDEARWLVRGQPRYFVSDASSPVHGSIWLSRRSAGWSRWRAGC